LAEGRLSSKLPKRENDSFVLFHFTANFAMMAAR
jgi:hypothetical protein